MKGCLRREHYGSLPAQEADADKIADRPLGAISSIYGDLTGDLADGQLRGMPGDDET